MRFFQNISKKNKMLIIAGAIVCLLAVIMLGFNSDKNETSTQTISYTYNNITEKNLAQDVKEYLDLYIILEEADKSIIAHDAVLNYRTILASNVQSITDDHTEALNKNMKNTLEEYTTKEQISDSDLDVVSNGISEIILDTLLKQIEASSMASMEAYQDEYIELTDSLQKQIDELKKKNTSVNITAHIKNNTDTEISNAKNEIYSHVNSELAGMKELIGNISDGEDGINGKTTYFAYAETSSGGGFSIVPTDKSKYIGTCISSEATQPTVSSMYGNWKLFVGRDGATGQTGASGSNGRDGKDGTNGTNGVNGKTTYFAYAEDANGGGFSLTPTETSKYIGTCISDKTKQPTKATAYSNWKLIVGKDGEAGADGKTTYFAYAEDVYGGGFSITPNEKTQYMGICTTNEESQPTDAASYNNWKLIVGQAGQDGRDGEAGADGKTTYIAYADNKFGGGFSLTPTETSKYIGTCISSEATQPASASYYSNWQLYRSYIITSTTDENNSTTLYIQ